MSGWRTLTRAGAAAAIVLSALLPTAPAGASEVSDRIEARAGVSRRIGALRQSSARQARRLHRAVVAAQRESDRRPGLRSLSVLDEARRAEQRHARRSERRLHILQAERAELEAWLTTWGVFRVCPVDPPRYIHDDFGEIVTVGDVEPHVHHGVDIEAPTWTPVRAPFDGYADASSSGLGGYEVRLDGDRGDIYIAHLVGWARSGWVGAGAIIGYVGSTGLSTAPHAHIQWNPWGGPVADPYYLLRLSCG
ncbi:MAG TPA: M23 family metallopeptidase [Actinomycetota bacterium]|nr:M23 family metallopeptidase [Actinomycetota bacterium]